MEKEVIISPEELYFLGSLMQAKYIDYSYVAAMGDIQQNYALFEKEAQAALVGAGLLMEDFSGNIELDADAATLLRPIFFGEVETSVDVCTIQEDRRGVDVYKLHFHDGRITLVTGEKNKLKLRSIDELGIDKLVNSLLPEGYSVPGGEVSDLKGATVSRVLSVKSAKIGGSSVVAAYLEADGVIYQEREAKMVSIGTQQFISDGSSIVKGVL